MIRAGNALSRRKVLYLQSLYPRRAICKDVRMGGTLHNVKRHRCLSCGCSEPENFELLVKDNVRSDCYGYVIIVTRSVLRGYFYPHAHFWEYDKYRRGQTLYLFTNRVSQDLEQQTVELEAHVFALYG